MKGRRPLNIDEVQRYLDYLKAVQTPEVLEKLEIKSNKRYAKRDRAWFALGVCTGFRISELMRLRIKDVSHNYQVIDYAELQARYTKGKPTNAKPRIVLNERTGRLKKIKPKKRSRREGRTAPIEIWAQKIIQEWVDELKTAKIPTTWLLFQAQGKTNRSLSRKQAVEIFKDNCTEIGIHGALGTHSMRKTFTLFMDSYYKEEFRKGNIDNPDRALMAAGGWSHIESMEKYRAFIHEMRRDKNVFNVNP